MSSWCSSQRRLSSRRCLWWRSCASFSCLAEKSTSSISSLSWLWLWCPPLSRLPGDACRALGASVGRRGEGRLGGARADILTCVPRGQLQGSGDTCWEESEEAAWFYQVRQNPVRGLQGRGNEARLAGCLRRPALRHASGPMTDANAPRPTSDTASGCQGKQNPIITYWRRLETCTIHFVSFTFSSNNVALGQNRGDSILTEHGWDKPCLFCVLFHESGASLFLVLNTGYSPPRYQISVRWKQDEADISEKHEVEGWMQSPKTTEAQRVPETLYQRCRYQRLFGTRRP